jgi:hypothetical protein
MGMPRSKYVKAGHEGVYHCFSRCVRRAFLYGFDPLTNRDFSHRKAWLVERLRFLASIFAIDVCAYSVMENHYHTILRTRPDIVASWSDRAVATRWLTLFPRHRDPGGTLLPPAEKEISALVDCAERIAQLRQRLCSLSWFMGRLNEFIARRANKEDGVKGRFWESRFKCQILLDEAAIAACMVYVDLNLIRAGLASTPEESTYTSIQERVQAWQKEMLQTATVRSQAAHDVQPETLSATMQTLGNDGKIGSPISNSTLSLNNSFGVSPLSYFWLCPIQSDSQRRGILQITSLDYFDLVDRSARMMRLDKRGAMNADLVPIMLRIGIKLEMWIETITQFGSQFSLVAGSIPSLRNLANQLGKRWFKGVASARGAFAS